MAELEHLLSVGWADPKFHSIKEAHTKLMEGEQVITRQVKWENNKEYQMLTE